MEDASKRLLNQLGMGVCDLCGGICELGKSCRCGHYTPTNIINILKEMNKAIENMDKTDEEPLDKPKPKTNPLVKKQSSIMDIIMTFHNKQETIAKENKAPFDDEVQTMTFAEIYDLLMTIGDLQDDN
jgi:hypothetical protein